MLNHLVHILFASAFCASVVISAETQAPKLNVVVLEGNGAINNIRQRVAREIIVQVEDENRKPVSGASVSFTLPDQGPSARFSNDSRNSVVQTDSVGRATVRGLRVNSIPGKMEIRIRASFQGQTASASIVQTNVVVATAAAAGAAGAATAAAGMGKVLAIVAIVAGVAVGGGIAAASRGGGGGTPAPPLFPPSTGTSIRPGLPVVGTPGAR